MRIPRIFYCAAFLSALAPCVSAQEIATGIVFHDANENQKFDSGEKVLPDIRVSNGREIVKTNAEGRYELPVDDDTILFVIKPKGWRTPLSEDMLPRFYYIHKPAGSRESKFPGLAPTGPLPESVNFPLYPQDEPETFKAIFFGDPQPRDLKEVGYNFHDVFETLIGTDASFGVTLGDIAMNDLSTFEPQNRSIAMIGIPWYNVIGNHDLNHDATNDSESDETFHRVYGPSYYSFDYGNVHFLALDDVEWKGPMREGAPYIAGLHPEQMQFIRNDLAMIPKDQMLVLMMHIPLQNVGNRRALFKLIQDRPFCMSISGHAHFQEHKFLTKEDGWEGPEPHHHIVNVTVCGSWWTGAPDEAGIPHTTMRDGAPNGYSIMTFDGNKYDWKFVAARRPLDYQMEIYAPKLLAADYETTEVVVNVFGGSEKSLVEMQTSPGGEWVKLEKVRREDPGYLHLKQLEKETSGPMVGLVLPQPMISDHIWVGSLPAGLSSGSHKVTVRETDFFGKVNTAHHLVEITK